MSIGGRIAWFIGGALFGSAGLRVLLQTQKTMNKLGEMIIRNVNETINDIFEVTGFVDILTIV
jgi:anti-sigma B factor antagonist